VNRQLSSLLDLPKKGRQAFQPRRRKHPGAPTSPPRRLCLQPRLRRVARDHRPATPRSTLRNSLPPTLIAASFFITCANSRTPLLNLLRQSALMERAALSGRRRHKAAHANAIDGPISGRHTPRSPARGGDRLWLHLPWPHLPPLLPRPLDESFGAQRRPRSQASRAGRPGPARYLRTMRDLGFATSRRNRKLRRRQRRQSRMFVSS
jgi:hypothetical protein